MTTRRAIRDISLLPDELGQDSFLDTIANLVGVLIILVMVVGSHARNVSVANNACAIEKAQLAALKQTVDKSKLAEENVRDEFALLERQLSAEERLLQVKTAERQQVLTLLTQLENELELRRAAADQEKQSEIAREQKIASLRQHLNDITRRIAASKAQLPQSNTIEHLPTPIAKTVFRDDVHFRLKGGKLAYVPLDDLVQLMRNEWEMKAEKLATTPRVVEAVGPVEGFQLQYELVSRTITQQSSAGPVAGRSIELDHFSLLPLFSTVGEALASALQPDSHFSKRLNSLSPEKHTISVWVYPDSFPEFNELKHWLYDRGFQTAAWPLSEGALISGGPNGFRATAQ